MGLEYGPTFQGLRAVWRREEEVFAEVALPEGETAGTFGLHPALLDSALHALGVAPLGWGSAPEGGTVHLPFSWREVAVSRSGVSHLRVCLWQAGEEAVSLALADEAGSPVGRVGSLAVRPVSAAQLSGARGGREESLFELGWTALPGSAGAPAGADGIEDPEGSRSARAWAVLGGRQGAVAAALEALGESDAPAGEAPVYRDLAALGQAIESGLGAVAEDDSAVLAGGTAADAPGTVLVDCTPEGGAWAGARPPAGAELDDGGVPAAVGASVRGVLGLLQGWLADERFASARLVLVTRGALAVEAGEPVSDLAGAAVWGLVRSAQSENPGRFVLVDLDGVQDSWRALRAALASDEPQVAVREGIVLGARLVRAGSGALAAPAGAGEWRLDYGEGGSLTDLHLVACPWFGEPLGSGQVRVALAAMGVNFRDLVAALGLVPLPGEDDAIGSEGAGVVLEVGPGVEGLHPGDRVLGLFSACFGPLSVTDQQLLVPVPEGWSFARAASVPSAFLTAYYGLVDLAGLGRGERLLVHAAAGGVGMAAVQLGNHLGAQVYGTASAGKWEALSALGLGAERLASSRDTDFRERFLEATGGAGMDVVLNALAHEFVDASLALLGSGGRFMEMGKTDIRDPAVVAAEHPGVVYRAFDVREPGPQRIREILLEVLDLYERGVFTPLPLRAWDVRRAPQAFRFMSQARHVGKLVLTLPAPVDREGTALITGGTGKLGGVLARHLVAEHGVRSLLLASRRGPDAPGVGELTSELQAMGAQVRVAACDVSDRDQLRALLEEIPQEHPLRMVVHAAVALEDGTIENLTAEGVERVLAPKVAGAWHLHELTEHMDVRAFVLFSSVAGTLGNPGQGSYAAANAFLDALAAHRRARGLPGISLAWGLWADLSEQIEKLGESERARLTRIGRALSSEEALRLFDAACAGDAALALPVRLEMAGLRTLARAGMLPPLFAGLVRTPSSRPVPAGEPLAQRLAGMAGRERERTLLRLIRGEVAAVLGHASSEAIDAQRSFKELGFDSLTALELRNRLNTATGLQLPATLIFDRPNPAALLAHLDGLLAPGQEPAGDSLEVELGRLEQALASLEEAELTQARARVQALLARVGGDAQAANSSADVAERIQSASDEEIFGFIERELGAGEVEEESGEGEPG